MSDLRVAAVILNWNCAPETLECVASLRASNDARLSVIVVDNASTDSSWEELQRATAEDLVLIQSGANLGYAGGNNVGIRAALESGADYVWILNPDTVVHPLCLDRLLEAAEQRPQGGIFVPKILYRARPDTIWYAGGNYDTVRALPYHWGIGAQDDSRFSTPCEVTFATGCSLFVRRGAFEQIGLLDDRYFLYWEDIQFSRKALGSGYKIYFIPAAVAWHQVMASSGHHAGWTPAFDYYYLRNRLWYIHEEHYGWTKALAYLWTVPLVLRRLARMIVREEEVRAAKLIAIARGLRDGVLKSPKRMPGGTS